MKNLKKERSLLEMQKNEERTKSLSQAQNEEVSQPQIASIPKVNEERTKSYGDYQPSAEPEKANTVKAEIKDERTKSFGDYQPNSQPEKPRTASVTNKEEKNEEKTENSQPNEKPTKTVDSGELISNGNELSKPTESKTTESTTLHKKESSASEKLQQFSGVQNSFSAENQKKKRRGTFNKKCSRERRY